MSQKKNYAGFWVRFFAGFLDCVFLAIPLAILFFATGFDDYQSFDFKNGSFSYSSFQASSSSNSQIANLICYGVNIAYIVYFLTNKHQATIGKRLLGIYVGNLDGSKLSKEKAICRALAAILTAMTAGLGFVVVIFTKEKISLHDFICGTRVFHGKK